MNQTHTLSLEEAEKLCRLFMDCRLSALEEAELEFVLLHADFDSPVIRETKEVMAVSRHVKFKEAGKIRKPPFSRNVSAWTFGTAAAAILMACVAIFRDIAYRSPDDPTCIAYVAGRQADNETAQKTAEADVARMERFMRTVTAQKAAEEAKVDQFKNLTNISK